MLVFVQAHCICAWCLDCSVWLWCDKILAILFSFCVAVEVMEHNGSGTEKHIKPI